MAKRRLDLLLIIDIEATCWQGESAPEGEESEIIEIGICTLDISSGQRLDKRSILVQPKHSRISEFCTQLTTITQEQVDQGISFTDACKILEEEYLSRERVWASYGDYDRAMFTKQCQQRQINYPFGTRHINIKTLFPILCAHPWEVGMAKALELLEIPLEGTHHRGGDDAWNIGAIASLLIQRSRYSTSTNQSHEEISN
jgi:inhibitor of KinA sporulation pathway (predicted exonuclease)